MKNHSTRTLKSFFAKSATKKPKYARNDIILKINHLAKAIAHARAIAFAKWSVSIKNLKMPKTCEKTILQDYSCSVKKTPLKKKQKQILIRSRKETILKIRHLAKAKADTKTTAFAKWSLSGKNLKCQKHVKTHSTTTLELFCAENRKKKH